MVTLRLTDLEAGGIEYGYVHLRTWLVEGREVLEDEVGMLTSTITGLELHVRRLERLLGKSTDDL